MTSPKPYRNLTMHTLNAVGRTLERVGLRVPHCEAERLMSRAAKATGHDDFGDASFREGLDVLCDAARNEARLNQLGRIASAKAIVDILKNRLQIVDHCKRHPEIEREEIRQPLFVVGMPRTGTTILYGLLAQDPNLRTPMTWEIDHPYPPPRPENHTTDPRIAKSQQGIDAFHAFAPGFNAIHPQAAILPDECQEITAHHFASIGFQHFLDIPSYQRWLLAQDFVPALRFHKLFLQYLQSSFPTSRWLLKSPAHFHYLPALLQAYPDAHIVQTHRDPASVIASVSSLTCIVRAVFRNEIDPSAVGHNQLAYWKSTMDKCLAARGPAGTQDPRFFDVQFEEIMEDPFGLIARIYAHEGRELTPEIRQRMERFLAENRRDKHGRHRYVLEDFGLTKDAVRAAFQTYIQRFDVAAAG
jgi:soluble cytochrome b562